MGKRGPAKTPTSVLAARGSWLAKTREDEPQATGSPEAPEWLTAPARAVWDRLVPRLESMGVAGSVDENAVARYVTLFARWRECEDYIASNGQVDLTTGKEYAQVGRASRLADQLLKIEQQYGMTAAARASLAVDTTKKKDVDGIAGKINPRLVG